MKLGLSALLVAGGIAGAAAFADSTTRVTVGNQVFEVPYEMQFEPSLASPDELYIMLKADDLARNIPQFRATVRGYVPNVKQDIPMGIRDGHKFDEYKANAARAKPLSIAAGSYDGRDVQMLAGQEALPAICNSSPDMNGTAYSSCLIVLRDDGLTFNFWANGENLASAGYIVRHARTLIRQWERPNGSTKRAGHSGGKGQCRATGCPQWRMSGPAGCHRRVFHLAADHRQPVERRARPVGDEVADDVIRPGDEDAIGMVGVGRG